MRKILAIFIILFIVCAATAYQSPNFLSPYNVGNQLKGTSYLGIIGLGVAFVIIAGGIDLSIGSVMGLVGCLLPMLLHRGVSVPVALSAVAGICLLIGLSHGLLITQLKIPPFVVTLCGMMTYRSIARTLAADQGQGFGNKFEGLQKLAIGKFSLTDLHLAVAPKWNYWIPVPLLFLLVMVGLASLFLNQTIYGRYILAVGRNEQAARYSGIRTNQMVLLTYVLCALAAGLAGVLVALDINSVQPVSQGEGYELYAIAVAVLGGCSLRGGEGTVVGVVLGAALLTVLRNSIGLVGIPDTLERTIVGAVILTAVIVDELFRRFAARRRVTAGTSGATP